jgi:hypothetical protein
VQVFAQGATFRGTVKTIAQSVAKSYDIFDSSFSGNQLEYYAHTATAVKELVSRAQFLKGEDDENVSHLNNFELAAY